MYDMGLGTCISIFVQYYEALTVAINTYELWVNILQDIWALCSINGYSNWVHKTWIYPIQRRRHFRTKISRSAFLLGEAAPPPSKNQIQ